MGYRGICALAWLAAGWCLLSAGPTVAQGWNDDTSSVPPAVAPDAAQAVDPDAVSGATIYVVDAYRHLATINLGTRAVHIVGTVGASLTDIAFNPQNHALYGVSFTGFYAINKYTAATRYIGNLGVSDANSLVFNSYGVPYSAGINSGDLYRINGATGRVSVVGSTGGYGSAGDLTFYNDQLVMTGFAGSRNIYTTTPNYLVTLNEKTGYREGTPILLPLKECFGLVSTGKNELYGLALDGSHAGLYQIYPTQPVESKRAVLLEDLTTKGLGQIYGAAYDGNYQP